MLDTTSLPTAAHLSINLVGINATSIWHQSTCAVLLLAIVSQALSYVCGGEHPFLLCTLARNG